MVVDERSAKEIYRLFFRFGGPELTGTWVRSSNRWRGNASIASTDFKMDENNEVVRVRRGSISFRRKSERKAPTKWKPSKPFTEMSFVELFAAAAFHNAHVLYPVK